MNNVNLLSLEELIESFLSYLKAKNSSELTIEQYRRYLKLYIKKIPIEKEEAKMLFKELASKYNPSSLNCIISVISSFCDYLIQEGIAQYNPFKKLKVKVPHKLPKVLRKNQAEEILSMMKEPYKTYCELMFYAGLRVSEVCSIKKGDIYKDDDGYVWIRVRGKGSYEREVLLEAPDPEKYLNFEATKTPYAIKCYLYNFSRKNGIPISSHYFRRTYGTLRAEKLPLPVLQALMGHKDPKTTANYYIRVNIKEALKRR